LIDAISDVEFDKENWKRTITRAGSFVEVKNNYPDIIKSMLFDGRNWVGISTGRTRSGKSYSMLTLCLAIDPNFTVDNVVFSAQEFITLLKSGKLQRGSMILWDETGVGLSSREWYSILNKSINYVLQTWGYNNIGLVLTVPHFSFVDVQTRKLCNAEIHTVKLVKSKGYVKAKIHNLTPYGNDIKRSRPRYHLGRGVGVADVEIVKFRKPPAKLVNLYEKKKRLFAEGLSSSIQVDLQRQDDSIKSKEAHMVSDDDLKVMAWEKLKDSIKLIRGIRKISQYEIKKALNITLDRARFIELYLVDKSKKENYPRDDDVDADPTKILKHC
jgi:hypothetical protein